MTVQEQAWLDQEDARVSDLIRRYGWSIEYVGGEMERDAFGSQRWSPPFAYTIGLFGMGHPELLITGVSADLAGHVLNELGDRVRSGQNLLPRQVLQVEGWPHRISPEQVPNPEEILFGANRHYRRPAVSSVPALQLSYDDPDGRFPWDPGCSYLEAQPRPGTFRA